jgi:hypothetical protein
MPMGMPSIGESGVPTRQRAAEASAASRAIRECQESNL